MAIQLGQGFAPYLLRHIKEVCKDATPQYKIEPIGFMNLLQSQQKPEILRLDTPAGHLKTVQIRYKQRWTPEFVKDTIDCDQTNVPSRREISVDLTSTSALNLNFEDDRIKRYEDDASAMVNDGAPPTRFMNDMLDEIMSATSAILQKVSRDLQTTLSGKIGVNRSTGNNASRTINIKQDTNINPLTDGFNEILSDYVKNGGTGTPQVFGSGIFNNWMLQQYAKSADQAGINSAIQARGIQWYYDLDAATKFGNNQIVVCEPNSVQIVEYMNNTGNFAGPRGTSFFGTLVLPLVTNGKVVPVMFDFQLRYSDCNTTYTDQYYGTTLNLGRGYNLIISKQCGLFTIPDDAYRATDAATGNRGTLRYTITNN